MHLAEFRVSICSRHIVGRIRILCFLRYIVDCYQYTACVHTGDFYRRGGPLIVHIMFGLTMTTFNVDYNHHGHCDFVDIF